MTTLIRSRIPLEDLSMANQPDRRFSKRLAATAMYDEQDGDFHFTRGSKRVKATIASPQPAPVSAPVRAPPPRIAAAAATTTATLSPPPPPQTASTSRPGRPKSTASQKRPPGRSKGSTRADAESPGGAAAAAAPSSTTRTSARQRTRASLERSSDPVEAAEKTNGAAAPARRRGRAPAPAPAPAPASTSTRHPEPTPEREPAPKRRGRGRPRSNGAAPEAAATVTPAVPPRSADNYELDDDDADDVAVIDDDGDNNEDDLGNHGVYNTGTTPLAASSQPPDQKIALPFSDTPIINRNKELRRKGGQRRSSVGMRGRRASSLIDSGHSALPHREVSSADFYKLIEAEQIEPRRMRQLLVWCGERALSEKPPHGSANTSAILGARAIQDQLLREFSNRSEFSNWFERDLLPEKPAKKAKKPVVVKPNPRNVEHEKKIAELEARIKRLKEEKKKWLALAKPLPDLPPLYTDGQDPAHTLPDASLLDPAEAQMLATIAPPRGTQAQEPPSVAFRTRLLSRLQTLQASAPFEVDHLAHNVHVLDQRVSVAGQEADRLLQLGAARLKAREDQEKTAVGTRNLPMMEVLRSLGRIIPQDRGAGSSRGGS